LRILCVTNFRPFILPAKASAYPPPLCVPSASRTSALLFYQQKPPPILRPFAYPLRNELPPFILPAKTSAYPPPLCVSFAQRTPAFYFTSKNLRLSSTPLRILCVTNFRLLFYQQKPPPILRPFAYPPRHELPPFILPAKTSAYPPPLCVSSASRTSAFYFTSKSLRVSSRPFAYPLRNEPQLFILPAKTSAYPPAPLRILCATNRSFLFYQQKPPRILRPFAYPPRHELPRHELPRAFTQALLNHFLTTCPFHNHSPDKTITGKNTNFTHIEAIGISETGP
jgi:hypothetical protein